MKIEIQHKDGSIEVAESPVQLQKGDMLIIDGNKSDMDSFDLSDNQLVITIDGKPFIIDGINLFEQNTQDFNTAEEAFAFSDEHTSIVFDSGEIIDDLNTLLEELDETAAGEEEPLRNDHYNPQFEERNGDIVNVEADLRGGNARQAEAELKDIELEAQADLFGYNDARKKDAISENDYRDDLGQDPEYVPEQEVGEYQPLPDTEFENTNGGDTVIAGGDDNGGTYSDGNSDDDKVINDNDLNPSNDTDTDIDIEQDNEHDGGDNDNTNTDEDGSQNVSETQDEENSENDSGKTGTDSEDESQEEEDEQVSEDEENETTDETEESNEENDSTPETDEEDEENVDDTDDSSTTVTLTPINPPTIITDFDNIETDNETPIIIPIEATDIEDGDDLEYEVIIEGGEGTVEIDEDNNIVYTPDEDYEGNVVITLIVTDSDGNTDRQSFDVGVIEPVEEETETEEVLTPIDENEAPTIDVANTATVQEDGSVDIAYDITDIDSENATIVGTAENGTIEITQDNIKFTPNENYNGTDTIELTITDSDGNVITKDIDVSIDAVNDAPTIENLDTQTIDTDSSVIFTAATLLTGASDIDGDTLSINNVSAINGSITELENGDYKFTPAADYVGEAIISYNINDGTVNVPNVVNMHITEDDGVVVTTPNIEVEYNNESVRTEVDPNVTTTETYQEEVEVEKTREVEVKTAVDTPMKDITTTETTTVQQEEEFQDTREVEENFINTREVEVDFEDTRMVTETFTNTRTETEEFQNTREVDGEDIMGTRPTDTVDSEAMENDGYTLETKPDTEAMQGNPGSGLITKEVWVSNETETFTNTRTETEEYQQEHTNTVVDSDAMETAGWTQNDDTYTKVEQEEFQNTRTEDEEFQNTREIEVEFTDTRDVTETFTNTRTETEEFQNTRTVDGEDTMGTRPTTIVDSDKMVEAGYQQDDSGKWYKETTKTFTNTRTETEEYQQEHEREIIDQPAMEADGWTLQDDGSYTKPVVEYYMDQRTENEEFENTREVEVEFTDTRDISETFTNTRTETEEFQNTRTVDGEDEMGTRPTDIVDTQSMETAGYTQNDDGEWVKESTEEFTNTRTETETFTDTRDITVEFQDTRTETETFINTRIEQEEFTNTRTETEEFQDTRDASETFTNTRTETEEFQDTRIIDNPDTMGTRNTDEVDTQSMETTGYIQNDDGVWVKETQEEFQNTRTESEEFTDTRNVNETFTNTRVEQEDFENTRDITVEFENTREISTDAQDDQIIYETEEYVQDDNIYEETFTNTREVEVEFEDSRIVEEEFTNTRTVTEEFQDTRDVEVEFTDTRDVEETFTNTRTETEEFENTREFEKEREIEDTQAMEDAGYIWVEGGTTEATSSDISITNASFETSNIHNGKWDNNVDGWVETGYTGDYDVSNNDYNNGEVQGENVAYVGGYKTGGSISQTLDETLSEGSTYTLNIDLGATNAWGTAGEFTINLYAGDEVIGTITESDVNIEAGKLNTGSIEVDTSSFPDDFSGFDQPLKIEISNPSKDNELHVDNVQMTKETPTETVEAHWEQTQQETFTDIRIEQQNVEVPGTAYDTTSQKTDTNLKFNASNNTTTGNIECDSGNTLNLEIKGFDAKDNGLVTLYNDGVEVGTYNIDDYFTEGTGGRIGTEDSIDITGAPTFNSYEIEATTGEEKGSGGFHKSDFDIIGGSSFSFMGMSMPFFGKDNSVKLKFEDKNDESSGINDLGHDSNEISIEIKSYNPDVDNGEVRLYDGEGNLVKTVDIDDVYDIKDNTDGLITVNSDVNFSSYEVVAVFGDKSGGSHGDSSEFKVGGAIENNPLDVMVVTDVEVEFENTRDVQVQVEPIMGTETYTETETFTDTREIEVQFEDTRIVQEEFQNTRTESEEFTNTRLVEEEFQDTRDISETFTNTRIETQEFQDTRTVDGEDTMGTRPTTIVDSDAMSSAGFTLVSGTWVTISTETFTDTKIEQETFTDTRDITVEFQDTRIVQEEFTNSREIEVEFTDTRMVQTPLQDDQIIYETEEYVVDENIVTETFTNSRDVEVEFQDTRIVQEEFTNTREIEVEFQDTRDITVEFQDTREIQVEFTNTRVESEEFTNMRDVTVEFEDTRLVETTIQDDQIIYTTETYVVDDNVYEETFTDTRDVTVEFEDIRIVQEEFTNTRTETETFTDTREITVDFENSRVITVTADEDDLLMTTETYETTETRDILVEFDDTRIVETPAQDDQIIYETEEYVVDDNIYQESFTDTRDITVEFEDTRIIQEEFTNTRTETETFTDTREVEVEFTDTRDITVTASESDLLMTTETTYNTEEREIEVEFEDTRIAGREATEDQIIYEMEEYVVDDNIYQETFTDTREVEVEFEDTRLVEETFTNTRTETEEFSDTRTVTEEFTNTRLVDVEVDSDVTVSVVDTEAITEQELVLEDGQYYSVSVETETYTETEMQDAEREVTTVDETMYDIEEDGVYYTEEQVTSETDVSSFNGSTTINIEGDSAGKYGRVMDIKNTEGETEFVLAFDKTGEKLRLWNADNGEQAVVDMKDMLSEGSEFSISFEITETGASLTVGGETSSINYSAPIDLETEGFTISEAPSGSYEVQGIVSETVVNDTESEVTPAVADNTIDMDFDTIEMDFDTIAANMESEADNPANEEHHVDMSDILVMEDTSMDATLTDLLPETEERENEPTEFTLGDTPIAEPTVDDSAYSGTFIDSTMSDMLNNELNNNINTDF